MAHSTSGMGLMGESPVRKLILVVGGVVALGGELAMANSVSCTMASLERTVELRYDNPGDAVPCEIRYAKPTEGFGEQVLWRAENQPGYCEARFGEFLDKLRGFGWSCGEPAADATDDRADDVAVAPEPDPEPAAPAEEPEATEDAAEEASVPAETDTSEAPTTE